MSGTGIIRSGYGKAPSYTTGGMFVAVGTCIIWFWDSVSTLSFRSRDPVLAVGTSDGKKELAKPNMPGQVAIRFLRDEDLTPKSKVTAAS